MIISMAGGITSAVVKSNKSYDIIGGSRGIQSQQYLDPSMTGVRTPLIIQLKYKYLGDQKKLSEYCSSKEIVESISEPIDKTSGKD